ncbi:MAG: TonB-dependent receptor [Bacteroidota bacterium]
MMPTLSARLAVLLAAILLAVPVAAQSGRVEGLVTDAEGVPLPGANVVLASPDTPETMRSGAATDIDGRFALAGIAPGAYVLTISFVGFEDARQPVVVRAGETTRVETVLLPTGGGLGDVVVTGQKVRRPLLETYASVGVLDSDAIEAFGVNTVTEAVELLGNVNQVEADTRKSITVRGINSDGLTQPVQDAQTVSVVIDGVTQSAVATRRGLRGLWDVSQIEVLRGPQSATYGRNAVAGALIIETEAPDLDAWGARARVIGAFADGRLDVVPEADAPPPDVPATTMLGREVALAVGGPIVPGQFALRASGLLARDEAGITYTDSASTVLDDGEFASGRLRLRATPAAIPGLELDLAYARTRDLPGNAQVSGTDSTFFERIADLPPVSEFRETGLETLAATVRYDVSDALALESVTARAAGLTDITTPEGLNFLRDEFRDQMDWTQEVRATLDAGRLSGTAGVFYGRFGRERDSRVEIVEPSFIIQDILSEGRTRTADAFASGRFDLGPVTALAGARYTAVDVEDRVVTFARDETRGDTTEVATSYGAFLPEAGLAVAIGEDHRLALTVSRGFRSGFAEAVARTNSVNEVGPESLISADLAWRARFFGGRATLAGTVFAYRYSDQQIAVEDTTIGGGVPLTVTRNAGRSSARGFEIEPRAEIVDGLTLFGSLGYVRATLDEFATVEGDFGGNVFPNAPEWTGALGLAYRHGSGVSAALTAAHTGSYFSSPGGGLEGLRNEEDSRVDGRTVFSARAGYRPPAVGSARLTLTAFADNLLDAEYLTSRAETFATVGRERTVGLELTVEI